MSNYLDILNRKNGWVSIFVLIVIGVLVGMIVAGSSPIIGVGIIGAIVLIPLCFIRPLWIALILLVIPLYKLELWRTPGIAPIELIYTLTFIVLLGSWLIRNFVGVILENEKNPDVNSPFMLPLLLFLVSGVISALIAIGKGISFSYWASDLNMMSFYLLYFVVAGSLHNSKQFDKLLRLLVIVILVAIIWSIVADIALGPAPILGYTTPKLGTLSTFSLLLFSVILPVVLMVKNGRRRNVLIGLETLLLIHLVLSFVRSRWLGLIAAVSFIFLILPVTRKRRFVKWVMVVVLILVVYILICISYPSENIVLKMPTNIAERFQTLFLVKTAPDATTLSRLDEYSAVWDKIKEHPIVGNGLGTEIMVTYYDQPWHPRELTRYIHNSTLFYWLNTGLLGLGAFIWFSFAFIYYGIRVFRNIKNEYWAGLALGFTAAFVAMFVTSISVPELSSPAKTIWIGFLFGGIVVIDKIMGNKQGEE